MVDKCFKNIQKTWLRKYHKVEPYQNESLYFMCPQHTYLLTDELSQKTALVYIGANSKLEAIKKAFLEAEMQKLKDISYEVNFQQLFIILLTEVYMILI